MNQLNIELRLKTADMDLDAARKAKDRKATWICLGRVAELKDMLALASESQREAAGTADDERGRSAENVQVKP